MSVQCWDGVGIVFLQCWGSIGRVSAQCWYSVGNVLGECWIKFYYSVGNVAYSSLESLSIRLPCFASNFWVFPRVTFKPVTSASSFLSFVGCK
jgi:hypothetical protein